MALQFKMAPENMYLCTIKTVHTAAKCGPNVIVHLHDQLHFTPLYESDIGIIISSVDVNCKVLN